MEKKILLEKYHIGSCSPEEITQIENLIESGEIQMEELEDHQQIASILESSMEVDEIVNVNFKKALNKSKINPPWKLILSLAILCSAFLVFSFFNQNSVGSENNNKPETMPLNFANELQQSTSSNEKIRMVSSENLNIDADSKIIDALLFALNNDKSTNVRLACVQTLSGYGHLENVRTGLINAIVNQKSAIVLNNIAEALNANGNQISKGEFEDRINKNLPQPLMKSIEENFIKI